MAFIVPASARTWIEVEPDSDFPIQNLPFGIANLGGRFELVTRVGETVVLLQQLAHHGYLEWDEESLSGDEPTLLRLAREDISDLRQRTFEALSGEPIDGAAKATTLLPASMVEMAAPRPTAYIDFYSGI